MARGYSDMVRFVALSQYGGIYIDADTVLLRDFSPYFCVQFSGRWGISNYYNTAPLGLHKNSTLARLLTNLSVLHNYNFHPMLMGFYLKEALTRKFAVFHDIGDLWRSSSFLWDGNWVIFDVTYSSSSLLSGTPQKYPHIPNFGRVFKSFFVQDAADFWVPFYSTVSSVLPPSIPSSFNAASPDVMEEGEISLSSSVQLKRDLFQPRKEHWVSPTKRVVYKELLFYEGLCLRSCSR